MGLTNEEINKLNFFNNIKLDRNQVETILNRKLTNREWKLYSKDYRKYLLLSLNRQLN